MGTSGSKLKRSGPGDVQNNLVWCVDQLAQWEDGASMVKELLATGVSEPTEVLAAVTSATAPSTAAAEVEQGPGATKEEELSIPEGKAGETSVPSVTKEVHFDASATRHLLYSVDEVLRRGESESYFKGIAPDRLEAMMSSPTSWFVLPPLRPDGKSELSSSQVFSLASVVQVLQQQKERGGTPSPTAVTREEKLALHKRSQAQVYGETPPQTPFNSPAPVSTAATGGGAAGSSEAESESKRGELQVPSTGGEVGRSPTAARTAGWSEGGGAKASAPLPTPHPSSASVQSVENQRRIIVARYLFIHHWFKVMIASAEFSCKSTMRLTQLRKLFRSGSKAWETMPPLSKLRYEKLYEESRLKRDRALISFDRARLSLDWLLRSYELSLANYKVSATLAQLKSVHQQLTQQSTTHSQLATSIRSTQLHEVNLQTQWFTRRLVQLQLEQQANERDSLNIGVHMLDRNLSGSLTSREVPHLPVQLFQLLDVRKRNEINTADLQQCVFNLCNKLDISETRLQQLSSLNATLSSHENYTEANAAQVERNKMEARKVELEMQEHKTALSSIYAFFHRAMILHVFAKAIPELARVDLSELSMDTLHSRLQAVEAEARTNPLEEELNLGMWDASSIGGVSHLGPSAQVPDVAAALPLELGQERGKSAEPTEAEAERRAEAEPSAHERPTKIESQPQPYLQRASPTPKAHAGVEEEKISTKDASALGGSPSTAAALPLIVHDTESGGVPKLHTTATATAEPSMGERIKEGIGGMFRKKEEPEESEVGEAAGERAEVPSHETSVSGAHAHAQKPSVIESVTEKVKEVLHIGQ